MKRSLFQVQVAGSRRERDWSHSTLLEKLKGKLSASNDKCVLSGVSPINENYFINILCFFEIFLLFLACVEHVGVRDLCKVDFS